MKKSFLPPLKEVNATEESKKRFAPLFMEPSPPPLRRTIQMESSREAKPLFYRFPFPLIKGKGSP
jgi:hypothetical protein